MKTTKTQMFVFIVACATIGIHVPIVALFLISVPIVALASRRWQNTYQNRIFTKLLYFSYKVWIKSFRLMKKKVVNSSIIL